jgi:hypothetical protein
LLHLIQAPVDAVAPDYTVAPPCPVAPG